MDITLTPEHESLVQAKIASGEYKNAAEVIREAIQRLALRDAAYDEWLRAEIMKGVASADRGELEDFDMDAITAEVLAEERAEELADV